MSVLIRGAKMPTNCLTCSIRRACEYGLYLIDCRPSKCPLVEVDDSITQFVEIAEQAGMEGKEAKFRMAGRLYAVRELPQ